MATEEARSTSPGTARKRGGGWRPVLLVSAVIALMIAVELGTMVFLEGVVRPPYPLGWDLFDALFLAVLLLPAFYLLLLRPMSAEIARRAGAEEALLEIQRDLERQVERRTRELQARVVEANLAREAAHFHSVLLDAVQEVIVATDLEGRITYWNRFAGEVFRLGPEAEGEGAGRFGIVGLDLCQADEATASILGGRSWSGETEIARHDGSSFPALTVCSPIRSSEGEFTGVISVSSDLTARKRAEEALRQSEHLYSTVVENSLTGIFIAGDGEILFANRQLARMLGYERPEGLLGLDAFDFVHPEEREKVREVAERRRRGEPVPESYETRCLTRSGGAIWVTARNQEIEYRGSRALLGNLADISEQKRAEAELLDSARQLKALSGQLMQAQESERAGIARDLHDGIGQTLTAVKFFLENAMERIRAGEDPDRALAPAIPRIQGAVEEVRQISMGLRPLTLDGLGILPTIAWFCREFQEAFPAIEVERRTEVQESEIPDSLKITLYRLLQEAMNNAAKHSGGERIRVALIASDEGLALSVEDDGRGLEFGPGGTLPVKESGFGLRSMRQRAELSGGTLTVGAGPEGGVLLRASWPKEALDRLRG